MVERRRLVALPPLRSVWLVAAGGAIGGLGRAAVGSWFPVREGAFPWSTWAENMLGAFLLAVLLTLLLERVINRTWVRPLLGTGMLGAFTTFATFAFELERLWAVGAYGMVAAYAAATAAGGLLVAALGVVTARRCMSWRGSAA